MKLSTKYTYKQIFFIVAILAFAGVVVYLWYRDSVGEPIILFPGKRSSEVCSEDQEVSTQELVSLLSDSVFPGNTRERSLQDDPVAYFKDGIKVFRNGHSQDHQIAFNVGYMYEIMIGAYLSGVYQNDQDLIALSDLINEYLIENVFPISELTGSTRYLHQNRESSCSVLQYRENMSPEVFDNIAQRCGDLYAYHFSFPRTDPDSLCKYRYNSIASLKEISQGLLNKELDVNAYLTIYNLNTGFNPGRGLDHLLLYDIEGSVDDCKKDAYYSTIAESMLFMISDLANNENKYSRQMIMEVLNVLSYGITSSGISDSEKQVLVSVKDDLLQALEEETTYTYSYSVPYGIIETSYVEICSRDPEFFSGLGEDVDLRYPLDNSCDHENLVVKEMVQRSCKVTGGKKMMLFSEPISNDNTGGNTISYASVAHSIRIMNNLILSDHDAN